MDIRIEMNEKLKSPV